MFIILGLTCLFFLCQGSPLSPHIEGQDNDDVKIFLCLWHTQKVWLKNATYKIKANYLRTKIISTCADLMYGNGILQGDAAITVAKDKVKYLKAMYPQAKVFLN